MLTDPLLVKLVAGARLVEWRASPALPVRMMRTLLLVPDAAAEIAKEPWTREPEDRSNADTRNRRRALHALLNNFIMGRRMTPDEDVKALRPTSSAFVDLVEMRSGPPRPQARLLILIYSPGVWIGLKFLSRSELGEMGDPRWEDAAGDVKQIWRDLFDNKNWMTVKYPIRSFLDLKRLADA